MILIDEILNKNYLYWALKSNPPEPTFCRYIVVIISLFSLLVSFFDVEAEYTTLTDLEVCSCSSTTNGLKLKLVNIFH